MKRISENLTLNRAELNNWRYEQDQVILIMYEVYFDFYENPYTVYVSPESLKDEFPDPASVEGPSELFDSFNSMLNDDEGNIWNAIREACKEADDNF